MSAITLKVRHSFNCKFPDKSSVGIPGSSLFPVPDAPYNLFPYLFLLYLAVTCGWFIVQRIRYPRIVRVMEHSIEEIHERFATFEPIVVPSSITTLPPNHFTSPHDD